jgi:trans-aconitate methyltransferase
MQHDHPPPQHDHRHLFESVERVDVAEIEGEVLGGLSTEATAVITQLGARDGHQIRRVLDLGCGPGVGSCHLAQSFPSATVVAVDGSSAMVDRAAARVARLGLAHRVETRHVALPDGLAALPPSDLVWASMVLHHIGDEVDALRRIRGLLEPGGLLAVMEHADALRLLPDHLDRSHPELAPMLEAAWAAWFADMRAGLPGTTTSAGYPIMLEQAGFEVLADQVLTLVVEPPLDERARRFAHRQLARARAQLGSYLAPADLDALDELIGDGGRRGDAPISASRHLYVARATA